jgi:hypothetical protein
VIDHPPGGHDDLANAAMGALVLASSGAASGVVMTRAEREEQYFEQYGHKPNLSVAPASRGTAPQSSYDVDLLVPAAPGPPTVTLSINAGIWPEFLGSTA